MSKKNKLLFNSIGKHFLIYLALFLAVFPIFWNWLNRYYITKRITQKTASSDFTRNVRYASRNKGSCLEHSFSLLLNQF